MERESMCEELEDKAEATEESEEAVEAKPAMTPYQPSQEEIDRHMLTHVPVSYTHLTLPTKRIV